MGERLRLKVETNGGEKFLTIENRGLKFEDFKMKIKGCMMEEFRKNVAGIQCKNSEGYVCVNGLSLGDVFGFDDVVHVEYIDSSGSVEAPLSSENVVVSNACNSDTEKQKRSRIRPSRAGTAKRKRVKNNKKQL